MPVRRIIWLQRFSDKIAEKHAVSEEEVEQVLKSGPHVRRVARGRVKGEDLYVALGRTVAGRKLAVLFIRKPPDAALPISARDMDESERRYYGKHERHP